MEIVKIVSGGQTGADRGGLDAAIDAGMPHGGWCPRGRRAEDGSIPDRYRLAETESPDYLERTEANVADSDATVVFTVGPPQGGSLETIRFAAAHGRPWLHVDLAALTVDDAAPLVAEWLDDATLPSRGTLNVAGSRESRSPGIRDTVWRIMGEVLRRRAA